MVFGKISKEIDILDSPRLLHVQLKLTIEILLVSGVRVRALEAPQTQFDDAGVEVFGELFDEGFLVGLVHSHLHPLQLQQVLKYLLLGLYSAKVAMQNIFGN